MVSDRKDVTTATHFQRVAADPKATRLASANAGSGKTKVLVERVSRLLLGGADPDKILCLTYTKAAASEMQSRLFKTLGEWSVIDRDDLNGALDKLLGEKKSRNDKEIGNARRLFAKALETPDGLKVQTIHAFCERILSRFPIEAGILPGFDAMEDTDVLALRAQTEEWIYASAWDAPKSELAQALAHLAAQKANQSLDGLFRWMAGNGENIEKWAASGGVKTLASRLGLMPGATVAQQYALAWSGDIKADIKAAAQDLLQSGNKNDVAKANNILAILTHPDLVDAFSKYSDVFLTQKGDLRKSPITLSAPAAAHMFFGNSKMEPTAEALRVQETCQNILAAEALENTRAVLTIANLYRAHYAAAKQARRWLDFDDQISLVRRLLVTSEVADWVRYKLDGGIGHILVDEAQDTAPDQWDIVDALKDGFALPDPNWPAEQIKTFFAVGDEKQSIYSFQGARPEKFIEKIRDYTADEGAAAVRMSMSFRSAPEVLRVVDGVFADQKGLQRMFNAEEVDVASEIVTHSAFRKDRGLVELWPITPPPTDPPEEVPWDMQPVDAPGQSSARERLAVQISEQIKKWIDEGEPVFDRSHNNGKGGTRAMHAGDVLILVRRRNDFFDAVIRNLKSRGVAVAGADRLVLKDAVAVKDLLALTRFVLLPADDLSLAEILRSPFFNVAEEALFEIASGRGELSLWAAVQNKAPQIAAQLKQIIGISRRYAPYEFYARVLDLPSLNGPSLLKNIYARLGIEAKDALEAFLARALAQQRRGAPSLQHFLQSFEEEDHDIKREMDAASGEVRVMTVHGAKGLEAPIVFLPDTTQKPSGKSGNGMIKIDDGYAYLPSAQSTPESLSAERDRLKERQAEEYMRLLYVAMTRAESRLIVCGFHSGRKDGKGFDKRCWHEEVANAMRGLDKCRTVQEGDNEILLYGRKAETPADAAQPLTLESLDLPDWTNRPAPQEPSTPRRVTPSHLLAPLPSYDAPVRSPAQAGFDRFRRGNIIHKLLEILPDMPTQERDKTAQTYLESYLDLTPSARAAIKSEVFDVLEHPDFKHIFAPGSRAEVSLAGHGGALPKGLFLNAQIDRLVVTDSHIYIVDYKSNRPPPTHQDDVPDIYWGQMAAYRELVRSLYPDRPVTCALLWTDGPHLMLLDDKRLSEALTLIPVVPI